MGLAEMSVPFDSARKKIFNFFLHFSGIMLKFAASLVLEYEPGGLARVSQDYFHCCLLDFHAHVPVEA